MSNNLRGNREPGLPHPHEVGDVVEGSKRVEENVQERTNLKTTENDETEAKRLFAEMSKELRERRKGLSKEDGQKIRMDKNSATYKEWVKVTNNILRDSLAEEQTDLTTQIKKAEHAKADAEVAVLKDKLIRNDKQLKRAEAAIREWNELNSRKMEVADERQDLVDKSSRLGGEQPAFVEKLRVVDAEAEVVSAEENAVAALAVGAGEELLDEGGISVVIENENFFAQSDVQKEKNEMFRDGKGTNIIRLYFSDQLARDAKKGIKGRDLYFTEVINKMVGDDVLFANLLVKDSRFKEATQELFSAKVGIISSAEMAKASVNLYRFLEDARSFYETMLRKEEPPAISEEGLEYIPAEAVKSVDSLRQNIDNNREELQKAQDLLKSYSWYQFKDKNQKKEEIKAIVEELNQSTQILLDLGEEIISENKAAVIKSNFELADKIQEVKQEVAAGADYTSRKYDNKYNKLVTALLTLLASTIVTQDTSDRRHIEEPAAAVKPVRMAEKTGLNLVGMPRVSGGMSVEKAREEGFSAVDMSTVPPVLPGYESGGPTFTTAELTPIVSVGEPDILEAKHGVGRLKKEVGTDVVVAPAEALKNVATSSKETVQKTAETEEDLSKYSVDVILGMLPSKGRRVYGGDVQRELFAPDTGAISMLEKAVKTNMTESEQSHLLVESKKILDSITQTGVDDPKVLKTLDLGNALYTRILADRASALHDVRIAEERKATAAEETHGSETVTSEEAPDTGKRNLESNLKELNYSIDGLLKKLPNLNNKQFTVPSEKENDLLLYKVGGAVDLVQQANEVLVVNNSADYYAKIHNLTEAKKKTMDVLGDLDVTKGQRRDAQNVLNLVDLFTQRLNVLAEKSDVAKTVPFKKETVGAKTKVPETAASKEAFAAAILKRDISEYQAKIKTLEAELPSLAMKGITTSELGDVDKTLYAENGKNEDKAGAISLVRRVGLVTSKDITSSEDYYKIHHTNNLAREKATKVIGDPGATDEQKRTAGLVLRIVAVNQSKIDALYGSLKK